MKQQRWTKTQLLSVVLSSLLLLLGMANHWFGWGLFGIAPAATSILTIFLGSLLLWLFVAIDWPSVLCIVLLGLGTLPEVTFGQVFSLSFGNATFVLLLFTFILTYALEQTNFLKRMVA